MEEHKHHIPVEMTSIITGKKHVRYYDMTAKQVQLYTSDRRPNIQGIFPELSNEDREFLISGITPEEWDATFPKGDEDE